MCKFCSYSHKLLKHTKKYQTEAQTYVQIKEHKINALALKGKKVKENAGEKI